MTGSILPFTPVRLRRVIASLVLAMLLVGCDNHDNLDSGTSLPRVDACMLVTAAMVQRFAHGIGAGYLMKSAVHQPNNIDTCAWDDARHIPALTLTVAPADPSGVTRGLADGFANMGYRIIPVTGLGEEAATAIATADPERGITGGVAILSVHVGPRQLVFSPVMLAISGPGTPAFQRLKQLATEAIARLQNGAGI